MLRMGRGAGDGGWIRELFVQARLLGRTIAIEPIAILCFVRREFVTQAD